MSHVREALFGFVFHMSKFTDNNKALIVQLYFENGKSATLAARKYGTIMGIKTKSDLPSEAYVRKLVDKFQNNGSVKRKDYKDRISKSPNMEKVLADAVNEIETNGGIASVRNVSQMGDVGCSSSTVYRVLKNELRWKPYKYKQVQTLPSHCYEERLKFCKWICNMADDNYVPRILFTDEANFYLDGYINKQNMRFWGPGPPNEVLERTLNSPKFTIWCGFSHGFRLQPFVFPFNSNVNGEAYRDLLSEHVVPSLKKLKKCKNTVFMQDGASPHTANLTKDILLKHFGENVIGRGFSQFWPSHSPDLNPCDFFLWGYIKDKVYLPGKKYASLVELKDAVIETFNSIPQECFQNAIDSFEYRAAKCCQLNGAHIEK